LMRAEIEILYMKKVCLSPFLLYVIFMRRLRVDSH
jgi:hypothetical protein